LNCKSTGGGLTEMRGRVEDVCHGGWGEKIKKEKGELITGRNLTTTERGDERKEPDVSEKKRKIGKRMGGGEENQRTERLGVQQWAGKRAMVGKVTIKKSN